MKNTMTEKILKSHLVEGELIKGEEIGIKIDQTLTQDATGTMAYLAFEALEIPRVRTELSVSYIDHNTLQTGFENPDDHLFLQSSAKKFGLYCSRPGNGICHSVHYQRFARPGKTLLGSDSHTPTSGALGTIAIGAGGMSVAMAMAGEPFYLKTPEVVNIKLINKLSAGVTAKDIILHLLKHYTVKGGVGKVFEYTGDGVSSLSIPERATITNMGAELGLTTSIFPCDETARVFMAAQDREDEWFEFGPDKDAEYDDVYEIDLAKLEPLVAQPHMPDKVVPAKELENVKVNQVFIGSCTNASYLDLARAAEILKGHSVHEDVSLSVAPGSKQVFEMIARDGILQTLISAGARILESACGPCVGIGQSPNSGGVSVRTSNRNFIGRSGTKDAQVYLASPELAAATAIKGYIADPKEYINDPEALLSLEESTDCIIDDRMVVKPVEQEIAEKVEIYRGPNIQPMPTNTKLENTIEVPVSIRVGDNITTDDIMPAGSKILPLRSNVPKISQYVFSGIDSNFSERAKEMGKSIVIGGENYGQGSSREHAALAPMYLGVQAVIAKSFARIHRDNLFNYGILPLVFENKEDYNLIDQEDVLVIEDLIDNMNSTYINVVNKTKGITIKTLLHGSERQLELLRLGGQLNAVKEKNKA